MFVHPPLHWHSAVHLNPAFLNLRCLEQFFLHPYLTSSWHDLTAYAIVIHMDEAPSHPNLLRSARSCSRFLAWTQLLLCKIERYICGNRSELDTFPPLGIRNHNTGFLVQKTAQIRWLSDITPLTDSFFYQITKFEKTNVCLSSPSIRHIHM